MLDTQSILLTGTSDARYVDWTIPASVLQGWIDDPSSNFGLLIDNQTPETVAAWGTRARGLRAGIEIEATGGITLENVRAYAEAGADFVSIGALTHSVRAADLAVEVRTLG